MSDKNNVAFIVEGEAREPLIIKNIKKVFFKHANFKIITLPACQNIYMLWKILEDDDYNTDVIEVLRECSTDVAKQLEGLERDDFSEVYLFFDYDGHQNNSNGEYSENVLESMLRNFNNETENGKLYVSYPMVEALRDFIETKCGDKENCYIDVVDITNYKFDSSERSEHPQFKNYDFDIWSKIIEVFIMKCSCFMNDKIDFSYDKYIECITPETIFVREQEEILEKRVFVLSAFPEFLIDYFGKKIWIKCFRHVTAYCN